MTKHLTAVLPPGPARADLAVLLAGALVALAFAPFFLFPLAVLLPAVLFFFWHQASPGRAAWRGFLFGLGQFGVGVSWLYVALHEYGDMNAFMAVPLLALFMAFLAGYPALLGWLQARLRDVQPAGSAASNGLWLHGAIVVPALWTIFEWMRGWFLSGFPWLDLGSSQIDGPLAGYVPVVGVYGVGFITVLCAGLIACGLRDRRRWPVSLALLTLIWGGGWLAGKLEWVTAEGKPLRAALVQGNVSLDQKWAPQYRDEIVRRYATLTLEQNNVDVVVWPEAALPATRDQLEEGFLQRLSAVAAERRMDILIGVLEKEYHADGRTYYNSVLNIGARPGVYRKHHLVPFGEYLPLQSLMRWLPDYLYIPMSDFSPGPAQQPLLEVAGHVTGISICYEDVFSAEVLRALPQATLLVNVSEDAWYGDSWAPHQHQQMARMRALETGRPMLRATNTGISALIDHRGRELARAPQFAIHVLTGTVQPMQGVTPFVRAGNTLVILVVFSLLVLALGIRYRDFWFFRTAP